MKKSNATHFNVLTDTKFSNVPQSRYYLVLITTIIGALFGLTFGITALIDENYALSIIDFLAFIGMAVAFAYLLQTGNSKVASYISLGVIAPFFLYLIMSQSVDYTGALWCFIFPVGTFFLLGLLHGAIASGTFFVLIFLIFFLPPLYEVSAKYSLEFKVRFTGAFAITSIIAFFYEYTQIKIVSQLQEQMKLRGIVESDLLKAKESAERLNDIAPCAIYTVDKHGTILSFNKWAEQITGYRIEDVLMKNCRELYSASDICCAHQDTSVIASANKVKCIIKCKDGSERTIQKNSSIIKNDQGEIIGGIETFVDITEQERTYQELVKARVRAEAANNSKSAFLANMSHEIRTPLNGILGMNSLLRETELILEQKEYAESIQSSAELLLSLINDILDFSKIEAGKIETEEIEFDIRTAIENAMELAAFKAHEKELEIASIISSRIPSRVIGDPGRFRQVIVNLAGNAVKFTDKGEVVLSAGVHEESKHFIKLHFEIRDTGIGIPQSKVKNLFKPFEQVDASTTRKFGGTGLGLAISKKLSELMEGAIGVTSREGDGSTFWFRIRFKKAPEDAPATLRPRGEVKGKCILLVDPNSAGRTSLLNYLALWDTHSSECGDAHGALDVLRQGIDNGKPFDVAIINMQLPGMNGVQLARLIKADPKLARTHIVITTAIGNRGDASLMKSVGVEAYLTKPVKHANLADCLSLVVARSSESESAGSSYDSALVTRHTLAEEVNKAKIRILLAEDNPVNEKVAIKMLEKAGFICDVAHNGMEALEEQGKKIYNLILMDCQMPVLSGYDATRAIREGEARVEGGAHVPIVAMTANAMKGDKQKCIDAGMDDYLSKPINKKELIEKVTHWTAESPAVSRGKVEHT
ncbi:MAG: response regulator [Chitinivibrionales bacterium]|nr:response regulator [Chitinivibrionales bacterium]